MNENLQQALAEIITRAIDGIDTGTEFLKEQLPDVVHQALLWHGVESFIFFLVGLLLLGSTIFFTNFFSKKIKKEAEKDGRANVLYLPLVIFFLIFFGISCSVLTIEWLQILIAPKLWLIEYASELVK